MPLLEEFTYFWDTVYSLLFLSEFIIIYVTLSRIKVHLLLM